MKFEQRYRTRCERNGFVYMTIIYRQSSIKITPVAETAHSQSLSLKRHDLHKDSSRFKSISAHVLVLSINCMIWLLFDSHGGSTRSLRYMGMAKHAEDICARRCIAYGKIQHTDTVHNRYSSARRDTRGHSPEHTP